MSQTIVRPAQYQPDQVPATPSRSLVAFAGAAALAGVMVYLVSLLVGRIG